MPEIDGFEVFRQIQRRAPLLPVIALTANACPANKEKALKAGFCDYFAKLLPKSTVSAKLSSSMSVVARIRRTRNPQAPVLNDHGCG